MGTLWLSGKLCAMNIEIHDRKLQARFQKQVNATDSRTVEEALLRLLETQEEQDRWLADNRVANSNKIQRGIQQLDRGEGIPDHKLDAHLARLKSNSE
jgi:hypothetical protein